MLDEAPARGERREVVVVGIGASAGGLPALRAFFEAMPADSGLAFVVVLHLAPDHQSAFPEILSRHTAMPVHEAVDGAAVEPDRVYVIPPNKTLAIGDGRLRLRDPVESRGMRKPIDALFRSLAREFGPRAVAIVLSGGGSDGTAGAVEVKGADGLVIAQEPHTAEQPSMPRSAIGKGVADFVAVVEAMPALLLRYARHPYPQGAAAPEAELEPVLALLRARRGFDFRDYRRGTLRRRIHRRMGLRHAATLDAYVELLQADAEEVHALFEDLLIRVTGFFREPEAFEAFQAEVVPALAAREGPIRAWVPGCSSGEEAYSIAMMLLDAAHGGTAIQVFATDVDERALAFARAGVYPGSVAAALPPELLERYFTEVDDDHHRVSASLRECITFSRHDILRDPPFGRLHLVSCRNLLIYFNREVQERLVSLFHFALRPGGFLFLGSAEGVGAATDLFEPVSKKWRIFRRTGARSSPAVLGHAPPLYPVAAPTAFQQLERDLSRARDELQGSIEELQSLNEELHAVNAQLQDKVEALEAANDDISNLLNSTAVATLFLDRSLRVRRFTPEATRLFDLIPADAGRPIGEVRHRFGEGDGMIEDARRVLDTIEPVEREVGTVDGGWYIRRVLPYRAGEDRVEGAVVTFTDITRRKLAEREAGRLAAAVEQSGDAVVATDAGGVVTNWNRGAEALYGYAASEAVGRDAAFVVPSGRREEFRELIRRAALGDEVPPVEMEHVARDGSVRDVWVRLSPFFDDARRVVGVCSVARDLRERKEAQRQQEMLVNELAHRVKNVLAIVKSIATQTAASSKSLPEFAGAFEGRLVALGRVHGLLTRGGEERTDMEALLRVALAPYPRAEECLSCEGPPLALAATAAVALGMVFHEMATNAVKYGALSVPTGRVRAAWKLDGGIVDLRWEEDGGPEVRPGPPGFGTRMIEETLRYELSGSAEIHRRPEGIVYRLCFRS